MNPSIIQGRYNHATSSQLISKAALRNTYNKLSVDYGYGLHLTMENIIKLLGIYIYIYIIYQLFHPKLMISSAINSKIRILIHKPLREVGVYADYASRVHMSHTYLQARG